MLQVLAVRSLTPCTSLSVFRVCPVCFYSYLPFSVPFPSFYGLSNAVTATARRETEGAPASILLSDAYKNKHWRFCFLRRSSSTISSSSSWCLGSWILVPVLLLNQQPQQKESRMRHQPILCLHLPESRFLLLYGHRGVTLVISSLSRAHQTCMQQVCRELGERV